jgi:hypothetical protein
MMTSTFKVNVTEIAPELSTRPVGVQARERILNLLEDYESVEVDFLNRSLTPSFADECIGRLAGIMGLETFKKRIKLLNLNESTKSLVKHVVLNRCRSVAA